VTRRAKNRLSSIRVKVAKQVAKPARKLAYSPQKGTIKATHPTGNKQYEIPKAFS
jgi:hypothetical protein